MANNNESRLANMSNGERLRRMEEADYSDEVFRENRKRASQSKSKSVDPFKRSVNAYSSSYNEYGYGDEWW